MSVCVCNKQRNLFIIKLLFIIKFAVDLLGKFVGKLAGNFNLPVADSAVF